MFISLILLLAAPLDSAEAPAATASAAATDPVPDLPPKLAKIYATGDGKSARTAFKVGSIAEEYQLLRALGLRLETQSLVTQDKPYDRMAVIDIRTGERRDVWFDVSSFFFKF